MSGRAVPSGTKLTEADAAIIKGMLARGDRQHDIAAWFGVNGGRIAEIATGATFGKVKASYHQLPPSGPYPAYRNVEQVRKALDRALEALAAAERELLFAK